MNMYHAIYDAEAAGAEVMYHDVSNATELCILILANPFRASKACWDSAG